MTAIPVSPSPAPHSSRRPPAPWADIRLLLGLFLIGLSIGGVWLVVVAARQTVPVFVAARTLVPGESVTADDLRLVDVALGGSDEVYLAPAALPRTMVASRAIGAGELVPRAALADTATAALTRVVIRSTADVPATVVAGAAVEVWSAPRVSPGEFEVPRVLVPDATVAAVTRDQGFGGTPSVSLELVVPHAVVAATLGAVADGAALSVVPARGGVR